MTTEPKQHRISSIIIRIATGFSTFILAVILSTHYNPLGPNISPGEIDRHSFRIVVAKMEIPVGARIIAEQLTVAPFPRRVGSEGTFAEIDHNLLGRLAVAKITPREPITESHLAPIGSVTGLSSVILDGYRAMTVRVDEIVGVSGFIMPGTLVDVVIVIHPRGSGNNDEKISKIVAQNIKVLASGQNIDKPKNNREVGRLAKTVTLQVTPEQAEKVAQASSQGKLQLVMRKSVGLGPTRSRVLTRSRLLA
jgi:pilus assembly protein CpaB